MFLNFRITLHYFKIDLFISTTIFTLLIPQDSTYYTMGSHRIGSDVAQLVGCWTHNPRVVGWIPGDLDCFMWDNILGQDVNLDCSSLQPGVMGTWLIVGS